LPSFAKSSKSLILMACLIGPKVRTIFWAPNARVQLDNILALAPKSMAMPIDPNFVNFIMTAKLKLIGAFYIVDAAVLFDKLATGICTTATHTISI